MFKSFCAPIALAIAVAVSLPSAAFAEGKSGRPTPASPKRIYNTAQKPTTPPNQPANETMMFTPPPLDPDYHGSNGG